MPAKCIIIKLFRKTREFNIYLPQQIHHGLMQISHSHNFIGNNNGLLLEGNCREEIFFTYLIWPCVYGNPIIMLTTIMLFFLYVEQVDVSLSNLSFVCTFYVVVVKIH